MRPQTSTDFPDFLVKSTMGVAILSVVLMTPFGLHNIINAHYAVGWLALIISLVCTVNAWYCYRGHYHNGINLFGTVPIITIAILFAVYEHGVMASYWAFLGVLSFYFMLPIQLAWKANIVYVGVLIPLAWYQFDESVAVRFVATLIGISLYAFFSMREVTSKHYQLKEKAVTDVLTGLYNRSTLQQTLEQAINQNSRAGIPMTLVMLDLDHFKSINDKFGHHTGDDVLKTFGNFLQDYFRSSDTVFRIGGEEFLVLLYNTGRVQAQSMAEKLRLEIESLSLVEGRALTASIGVAGLETGLSWEDWMKNCDANLLKAKSNGRNQVIA